MLLMVSRLIAPLHPVGSCDSKYSESIPQDDLRRSRERKTCARDVLRLSQHMVLVIPKVRQPRRFREIRDYSLRLERCRCTRDDRREIDETLDQLLLFRLTEHAEVDAFARYRVGRNLSHAKDPAHPRVRHLHVVNRVLL